LHHIYLTYSTSCGALVKKYKSEFSINTMTSPLKEQGEDKDIGVKT